MIRGETKHLFTLMRREMAEDFISLETRIQIYEKENGVRMIGLFDFNGKLLKKKVLAVTISEFETPPTSAVKGE